MSQYKEDTETYVVERQSGGINGKVGNFTLEEIAEYTYAGDIDLNKTYKERLINTKQLVLSSTGYDLENIDWSKITKIDQKFYRERLAVEGGKLIWFAESEKEQEVKWCLELGIQVFVIGKGYLADDGTYIVGSSGGYGNTIGDTSEGMASGVYCCAPDLKDSFNTGATYYLEYNEVNGEAVAKIGDPIYKEAPSGWYDYGNKKWANIVTSSNGHLTYLTWIPRYMVKVYDDGQIGKKNEEKIEGIDIVFVDLENNAIISGGVNKTRQELESEGYILPDAFRFGGVELSGIWVGKYEMSDPKEPIGFTATSTDKSITINSFTVEGRNDATVDSEDLTKKSVKVTVLETNQTVEGTLPLTVDNLATNQEYTVRVTIPTNYLEDLVLDKKVRTAVGTLEDITAPDLSGFNKDTTYFATFEGNTATIKDKIQTEKDNLVSSREIAKNAPDGWYDYSSKKWANIVTMKETGEAAYWTWIPRYEYKIDEKLKGIDIVYITADQKADEGYEIPDAFEFGGKQLSGIWVGKYEIEDVAIPKGFTTTSCNKGFVISSITYEGTSMTSNMPKTGTVTVCKKDGTEVCNEKAFTVGQTEIKLPSGCESGIYDVTVKIELSYNNSSNQKQYKTLTEKIVIKDNINIEEPDLSGFKNGANAYYIIYDNISSSADGKVGDKVAFDASGKINNAPDNWYDYANKKWANIIVTKETLTKDTPVTANGLTGITDACVFVWIPKYEYKVDDEGKSISTVFLGKDDTKNDDGYEIPDAFKFGGNNLGGIWVGKYEISGESEKKYNNGEFK